MSSDWNESKLLEKTIELEQRAAELEAKWEKKLGEIMEPALKERDKLLYRIQILKNACQNEKNQVVTHMKDILNMLKLYFTIAVRKSYPELTDFDVQVTQATNAKFGDYQCNAAPPLSGILKSKGIKKNPREIANEILSNLYPNDVIAKTEIAGPGFINITLTQEFILCETKNVFLNGVSMVPLIYRKKVLVDMSAPNIAKEMHVGHLRSTIIGESISRLMAFLGYDVVRINHIGDWGTQFGMLIAHLKDQFPNYLKKDFYLPINDLQSFYKEAKRRFDDDEEFKKRAYECVVKLQGHDPDILTAWKMICDVSRKEFSKIYERLNIQNLIERGESFYQSRMEAVVADLEKQGFLVEDCPEGESALTGKRKLMFSTKKFPLIIVKSDGGYTYDTSDMATIKHRIHEEKAHWLIYVVDAGQSTHFETIFDCAQQAGIWDPSQVRVDHVAFGVVLGEDKKKFKSRSGDTVRLADLLDEGIKRAEDKLKEKGRDQEMTPEEFEAAKTAVAYGCIKYADLSHNRNHEYVFSFDKMLDDKGNTAVYLLYAYTRIKSISKKAGVSLNELRNYANSEPFILEHEKEKKLMKTILKFPEVINKTSNDLVLHPLCELLYEIATTFTEFYDSCYCIEKDENGVIKKIHMNRLILCEATASVLATGFDILGLQPVEKM